MSVGPLIGVAGSAAGSQLAQSTADVEHARQLSTSHERQTSSLERSARAAGIAEPDGQDLAAHDRDADGRRPWELPPLPSGPQPPKGDRPSQDSSGHRGLSLDLTG